MDDIFPSPHLRPRSNWSNIIVIAAMLLPQLMILSMMGEMAMQAGNEVEAKNPLDLENNTGPNEASNFNKSSVIERNDKHCIDEIRLRALLEEKDEQILHLVALLTGLKKEKATGASSIEKDGSLMKVKEMTYLNEAGGNPQMSKIETETKTKSPIDLGEKIENLKTEMISLHALYQKKDEQILSLVERLIDYHKETTARTGSIEKHEI